MHMNDSLELPTWIITSTSRLTGQECLLCLFHELRNRICSYYLLKMSSICVESAL